MIELRKSWFMKNLKKKIPQNFPLNALGPEKNIF